MSPPVKAPLDPELASDTQRDAGAPTATTTSAAPTGATLSPPQAAILQGQQAAGNRAMAAVLGGGRGIQRAPNDDAPDPRTSGMAHAPTLDPRPSPAPNIASSTALGPTQAPAGPLQLNTDTPISGMGNPAPPLRVNSDTPISGMGNPAPPLRVNSDTPISGMGNPAGPGPGGPARGGPAGPPTGGGAPGPARGAPGDPDFVRGGPLPQGGSVFGQREQWWQSDPRFAVGGEFGPKQVGPGQFGGRAKPVSVDPVPTPVNAQIVGPAFDRDPSRVIRSPDPDYHRQAWEFSRGPQTFGKAPPPQAFTDGRFYYVAPDYPGKATELPGYAAIGDVGLGKPGTAGVGGAGGGAGSGTGGVPATPKVDASSPPPPPPDRMRQAVAPYTPYTGEPRGTQKAQPTTFSEVQAALEKDPTKVVRSPNDRWHRQGYQLDGGGRYPPPAFKVGDLYVVGPDYPIKGVPKLGEEAPAKPSAVLAAQTISPTGYVPQERKRAKVEVKDGALTREVTDEEKRVTGATTDTRSRSSKQSISLAKGAGQEWKQRQESQTGDSYNATERSRKVNVSLQEGLKLETGRTNETGTGPDAPKTKTEVKAGMTAGPGGIGGQGTAAITSQSGAKAEGNVGAKFGKDGVELSAMGSYTTSKGFKGHMSVSGKHNVVAGDPQKLDNGKYSVTFTITDSKGVELGGGFSKPGGGGGPNVGLNVGSSTTTSNYETRVFDTLPEAQLFQLTAAFRVESEKDAMAKATTADGALAMKEGESRGTSQTDADTIGGSAGMSQVSVGIASTDSTTHGLRIEKKAGNKVWVTPSVAEQEALNASISAAGVFSNTKGSSDTKTFSVTYEFDLTSENGKRAYETYCKVRWPPPMPPNARWINSITGHAFEDHDVYKFAGIGQIGWQDSAWQQRTVDERGTHDVAGGVQSHKVDLNWVRHLTFDENVHSETQIVGRLEDGKAEGFQGQMTVGGESGSYNREQFGKIFSGARAKPGVEVKNSGEWTLSADIDARMFEQLAVLNKDMRNAKTREEKLKIYSELAKKGGAQMLSGQVRGGGKKLAWNLELKGDPNFPGAAGRDALNAQRARLAAQLKNQPATAGAIAAEAKDVITALTKRLEAISDEKKYTDLPDELRQTQKDLVNDHLAQFKSLRQQAISASMRANPKEDLTDTLKRASSGRGYDEVKKENREVAKLRDKITIHETEITALAKEITGTYRIVTRMFGGTGDVRWGEGVKKEIYVERNANAKRYLSMARSMDERLKVAAQKARDLREKWTSQTDPKDNEANMRALDAALLDQIKIMDVQLESLRDATREAYVVTSDAAIGRDWAFYRTIKVDGEARSLAISGLTDDDL